MNASNNDYWVPLDLRAVREEWLRNQAELFQGGEVQPSLDDVADWLNDGVAPEAKADMVVALCEEGIGGTRGDHYLLFRLGHRGKARAFAASITQ